VEGLGDGDEGDAAAVEDLDQLGEARERPGEPLDPIDHHHLDQPGFDVGQQPLQRRPFQRAARKAAIVVAVAQRPLALRLLAHDIGLAGLALGSEAVELLFQALSRPGGRGRPAATLGPFSPASGRRSG
jgi:hypothetical protein